MELSPEVLRRLFEAAPDAIVVVDICGTIVLVTAHAETMFGYAREELMGAPIEMLLPPRHRASHPADRARYLADPVVRPMGVGRDLHARRKDGSEFPVEITLSHVQMQSGLLVASAIRDITERKLAERTLREAQELARLGAWRWSAQDQAATWSPQAYALFGRDPALRPASGGALIAYVHAEDRARVAEHFGHAGGPTGEFEFEFQIRTDQGAERVLHAIAREDPQQPGAYRGTFQDLTDQRRAERAEAASLAKSQFLSRMSHELRTPLNAISGFSQLLAMDDLSPDQAENVDYVLKGANHLLALVDDVLDFSRIEAGQMKVSSEPVALADAVADAVTLIAPLAANATVGIQVDASALEGGQHVQADSRRLKQVLLNVLSNAVKYNHSGGRVEVSFKTLDDGRVRTAIADTGIGINREYMRQLFEPFERLGADQRAIDGTGLGLALSRGLVEAMGGSIEATSEPGVGSTFTIELAGAVAADAEEGRLGAAPQAEPEPPCLRVLYIEDNLSNLKLAERILQRHGPVEMISAMQGSLGLQLAREHRPDLVILDLQLPDMPGDEVLQRLRAEPETRGTPVIVLTADASKGLAKRLILLGATEFMQKPLNVAHFLEMLAIHGR